MLRATKRGVTEVGRQDKGALKQQVRGEAIRSSQFAKGDDNTVPGLEAERK